METTFREIIVYKFEPQSSNPTLGLLRAVAEKIDNAYIPLTTSNFCLSQKVFVTHGYEEINDKYKEYQLFKVIVKETEVLLDDGWSDRNCTYVTKSSEASNLKPSEMVEIISVALPDPNNMVIGIDNLPSTTYIYLHHENTCYGPFKWLSENENTYQITLKKPDAPLPGKGKGLPKGSIYSGNFKELKKHTITCAMNDGNRTYFESMDALHHDTHLEKMDYFSDEDIVTNFVKIAKEIGFSSKKIDLEYLNINVKKHPKHGQKDSIDKLKRLNDIADEQKLLRDNVIEEFTKFFRSELGDAVTKKYISNHKDNYLSQIKKDYNTKLENEFIEKSHEIDKLKEKITINKQELVDLGRDIEKRSNVSTDFLYSVKENKELDGEIKQKENRLTVLNEKTEALLEKYSQYNSLDDLENKIAELEKERDFNSREKYKIEEQIKALETQYSKSEDKLRTKLFDLKPFVEAINGNTGAPRQSHIKEVSQEAIYIEATHDNAQNIIKHIEHRLKAEKRNISTLDVINITITLQQSFISFLAGLPGGGKTTLARLVAKSYGIQENRFLDVPVARGWTGQRDLIGFFNPISNKFQSSSTGMYEFLGALSDESQNKDAEAPLSLVLLDEANLSPMEHYWSSFMGMTDSRGTACLKLGDKDVHIPDNLRFISTINYDSTTEYLSPRLIDRAPIIVLEPNTIITTSNQHLDEDNTPIIQVPVSYHIMEKYFGRTDDIPEFIGSELTIYDDVKAILEERNNHLGKPVIISNRKEIAIRQYCNKARPLMRECSTDDDFLAIDYAILQFILPLLRGHGKNFGRRLEKLKEILLGYELERSVAYLETIINNGNADLHTYDFFCW